MSKIGIMGGTFNPIHHGHLLLAEYAKSEMNLDEIWFVPTGCSYLKRNHDVLSGEDRLAMVQMSIESYPDYKCLDIEVLRKGDTYTYETLEELKEMYPEHVFYFIVGADCLFSIENWVEPQKIFDNCILLAAVRDHVAFSSMEQKCEELKQNFKAQIQLLHFPMFDLSSTEIRNRIANGKSVRFMISDSVIDYIYQKGFYRNENERR